MNPSESQRLEGHRLLAQALFGAERYEEAIAHCQEYLRSKPDEPSVLTRLAVSLVAVGRLQDAVAPFRRAAELDPTNPDAQRNLAFALADLEAAERSR
jgi:Flp pilus assembly protein TadD